MDKDILSENNTLDVKSIPETIKSVKQIISSYALTAVEASLRTKIKHYKKIAHEIEQYLAKHPDEWKKFQNEFNAEINNIFREIMEFEKESFANDRKERLLKLKQIFTNRIRKVFLKGVYNRWSLDKPYGYAGDFKIIDDIYLNEPPTTGFDRLFDNYFQMSAISIAVRNRKEDFKKLIINFLTERKNQPVRIMNLASGPCREIKEILSSNITLNKNVVIDCYDHDKRSLDFAKNILSGHGNVNFIQENALRLAVSKDINSMLKRRYDFIYSTGLFDYLNYRISVRLIKNLKHLLNPEGVLAIADVRDKYSNPSVHYMEWVGEWNLLYRQDDEFKKIFIDAGFNDTELKAQYEQQKIVQYIIAVNKIKQ